MREDGKEVPEDKKWTDRGREMCGNAGKKKRERDQTVRNDMLDIYV